MQDCPCEVADRPIAEIQTCQPICSEADVDFLPRLRTRTDQATAKTPASGDLRKRYLPTDGSHV